MKEGVPIYFKEKKNPDEQTEAIALKIEQFVQNNPVEFSEEERSQLMDDYGRLAGQGLNGIVHLIHQGSGTGSMIERELPPEFREKYYHRLHILKREAGEKQSRRVKAGDTVVYISEDGSIDTENQKLLDTMMKDRVGILAGGGAGSPKDALYQPLLRALEGEVEKGTPGLGICLGHQLFGELIMQMRAKATEGVIGGSFEGPISRERVTEEGQKNTLFQRFGKGFTTGSWNEFHLALPDEVTQEKDTFKQGRDLTRSSATEYPTSLALHGTKQDQILSIQRHPEFRIQGIGIDILLEDKILKFPDGSNLVVPVGSSLDMVSWAEDMVSEPDFSIFKAKYGITTDDIRNIFRSEILTPSLGMDFYGPALSYMSQFRLNQK